MDNIYHKTRWQSILTHLKKTSEEKSPYSLKVGRVSDYLAWEKQRETGDVCQPRDLENAKEPIGIHGKAQWRHLKAAAKAQSGFSHSSDKWVQMPALRSWVILGLVNSQNSPNRIPFLNRAPHWPETFRSCATTGLSLELKCIFYSLSSLIRAKSWVCASAHHVSC